MNSVHEPGSRIMSKNRLRNSTESKTQVKTKPSAQAPKLAQLGRPGAHWRAQARARLAVSWAGWPCHGRAPLPYRSPSCRVVALMRVPLPAVPLASCPAPLRALPRAPARRALRVAGLHSCIVSAQAAVSWACAVRAPGRVVA